MSRFDFKIFLLCAVCSCSGIQNPDEALPSAPPLPDSFPVKQRGYWPTADWRVTPSDQAFDAEKLKALDTYAFERKGNDQDRKGTRTDGIVIIRNGNLIYEKYARGYQVDTPHLIWSCAKSFGSALIGIGVMEGKLKLSDSASAYFPELKEGKKSEITVEHLLQMSSGLAFNEGYEASPLNSSVIAMLYTAGRGDMPRYTANLALKSRPGTRWYYSSGDTNLALGVLRKTMSEDEYQNYPWTRLFDRIGMKRVIFERDGSGNYVASSYIYAPPRELAKFGFLYLNDGMWDGKRLLPEGWVTYSRTLAPSFFAHPPEHANEENYGAQWWLNRGIPEKKIERPWPDAPADTYAALGHWGQRIFVIPSLDVVAVRVGDDREKPPIPGSWDDNEFLKHLISALK